MLMSEDKGNDNQLKKLMIVKQILLVSALVNVQRYREQYEEFEY